MFNTPFRLIYENVQIFVLPLINTKITSGDRSRARRSKLVHDFDRDFYTSHKGVNAGLYVDFGFQISGSDGFGLDLEL